MYAQHLPSLLDYFVIIHKPNKLRAGTSTKSSISPTRILTRKSTPATAEVARPSNDTSRTIHFYLSNDRASGATSTVFYLYNIGRMRS